VFFIATIMGALEQVGFLKTAMAHQLYAQVGIGILGGAMGLVGGAIGKKIGGVLLIVGSFLSLIAGGLFGILPFILLLIGGILALKEKIAGEKTSATTIIAVVIILVVVAGVAYYLTLPPALTPTPTITPAPTPSPPPKPTPTSAPTPTPTPTITPYPSPSPTPTPTPTPKLTWREVIAWQGSGAMNTETFEIIGSSWRVNWTSKGGRDSLLQIFIYDENSNLVGLAANIQGSSSDSSYVHKEGRYYLKINSANMDWTIVVEEEAPIDTEPVGSVMPQNYKVVKTWSGSGTKNTEKFLISKHPWRISWEVSDGDVGLLQIFIYDDEENMIDMAANVMKTADGYSYVYTKEGKFYLTINSANVNWKITVEEPQ